MRYFSFIHITPLGKVMIRCNEEYITMVHFMDEGEEHPQQDSHPLINACIQQLDEYFAGIRKVFDLPLGQQGTAFQEKVWELLLTIPYGKTTSYQALSKLYGDTKAIRAVAAANGKNNIAIIVPCHRVIGSNQALVGYAGGLQRKRWLLDLEARNTHGLQEINFEPIANGH